MGLNFKYQENQILIIFELLFGDSYLSSDINHIKFLIPFIMILVKTS